jgi:hypothetical protein
MISSPDSLMIEMDEFNKTAEVYKTLLNKTLNGFSLSSVQMH